MSIEMILAIIGVICTLMAGIWALLTLAGRTWARIQNIQFETVNANMKTLQARMEIYHNDTVRIELKISESEKLALTMFARDQEVKAVRREFEEKSISMLRELRDMGNRIDKTLETFSGFMSRSTDHRG